MLFRGHKNSNTDSNFWFVLEYSYTRPQAEHSKLNQASWLTQATDKERSVSRSLQPETQMPLTAGCTFQP